MTTLLQSNFNTFYDFAIDYDMVGSKKFLQDYRETATSFAKKYGTVDWRNIDSAQAKHIMTDVGLNLSGQAMEQFGDFAKEMSGYHWPPAGDQQALRRESLPPLPGTASILF